jgi:hypothetical protein
MKQVTINLYSFNELSEAAKENAIYEHMRFMYSLESRYEEGNLNSVEEITESEVIESIEINDYLFYFNGEMAYVTTYTGKHDKTGTSEFKLHGETYLIK